MQKDRLQEDRVQEDIEGRLDIPAGERSTLRETCPQLRREFMLRHQWDNCLIAMGDYVKDFQGVCGKQRLAFSRPAAVVAFLSGCGEAVAWF